MPPSSKKKSEYPVDRQGKPYGPECFDNDMIATPEQLRKAYPKGWLEKQLEKDRAWRRKVRP